MKFVALVSGGKDSIYSIMECIRNGHELVACAHLSPPCHKSENEDDEIEESYMYQSAASECLSTQIEQCLGVPLITRQRVGKSQNTALVYDHTTSGSDTINHDEVEDLYLLIQQVISEYPSVQGISSGAILSSYQRTRIESVCGRLNLTPLGYLWRIGPQRKLLQCMLEDQVEAILVKVASPPGLIPRKHLNKTLNELFYGGVFDTLKTRFDFHICGEGGEYETLVTDCPLFKKRLVIEDFDIIESDDGVGILQIHQCVAVDKSLSSCDTNCTNDWKMRNLKNTMDCSSTASDKIQNIDESSSSSTNCDLLATTDARVHSTNYDEDHIIISPHHVVHLPRVKILPGGLAHVSEIISQFPPNRFEKQVYCNDDDFIDVNESGKDIEAELAVLEAKCILSTLEKTLANIRWINDKQGVSCGGATANDVVFVHIYLSSIDYFAKINKYYSDFFGTILPPSRSCVAVGKNVLPGGRRVMMDCLIQRGSGAYMRARPVNENTETMSQHRSISSTSDFVQQEKMNPHHQLRYTLHVQTMSHWAPICVGPYSQANTLRSGITFLAGQIGLVPGTMKLIQGGWKAQLRQSWMNAASVLDSLGGTLNDMLGGVIYISSNIIKEGGNCNLIKYEIERISRTQLANNGGVNAGSVDESNADSCELYDGYEDYETWKEMTKTENSEDLKKDPIPLLIVFIPEMPVGAVVEVELICASKKATSCLNVEVTSATDSLSPLIKSDDIQIDGHDDTWDLGYDGSSDIQTLSDPEPNTNNNILYQSFACSIGEGCSVVSFVTASIKSDPSKLTNVFSMDTEEVMYDMINMAINSIERNKLDKKYVLHVRLFHTPSFGEHVIALRSSIHSMLYLIWSTKHESNSVRSERVGRSVPACSVVPVDAINFSPFIQCGADDQFNKQTTVLALQVLAMDLIHLETEMWTYHNR